MSKKIEALIKKCVYLLDQYGTTTVSGRLESRYLHVGKCGTLSSLGDFAKFKGYGGQVLEFSYSCGLSEAYYPDVETLEQVRLLIEAMEEKIKETQAYLADSETA